MILSVCFILYMYRIQYATHLLHFVLYIIQYAEHKVLKNCPYGVLNTLLEGSPTRLYEAHTTKLLGPGGIETLNNF